MDKIILKSSVLAATACLFVFSCMSCGSDDGVTRPSIESVWSNMTTQPVEPVACAYPGQTISLRGSGFSGVNTLTVNGMDIDLTETQFYNTDRSIIIVLPDDVATTTDTGAAYLKVSNAAGEATYQPFYVFSADEQPEITSVSSTTLTAGSTLCIAGANLGGATEVYLPLAFDQKVKCGFDTARTNSDTEVYVIVPDGVSFAQGKVEVVMTKTYAATGDEYVEKVYSNEYNFSN